MHLYVDFPDAEVGRIGYVLKRSKRRRGISLLVTDEGLRVWAPMRASQDEIEALLMRHAAWIRRKLDDREMRLSPRLTWRSGDRIMVLGGPVVLEFDPSCHYVDRRVDTLLLPFNAEGDQMLARQHAIAWLREQAQICFKTRVAFYASILRVQPVTIRLSDARTRWGTCHPKGLIRLNWRLIQMPMALLDYVVVHELAHLKVPNHSPAFWREVARVLPDYDARRRALRLDGSRYLLR